MKRLIATCLLALLCVSSIGSSTKSLADAAMLRALALAKVPVAEWQPWKQPEVSLIDEPRYFPVSPTEGNRLCGDFTPMYVGGVGPGYFKMFIRVFTRPQEGTLRFDVLTHEYLHWVWLMKLVEGDKEFINANPDSEDYVQSLIPNTCPNV